MLQYFRREIRSDRNDYKYENVNHKNYYADFRMSFFDSKKNHFCIC